MTAHIAELSSLLLRVVSTHMATTYVFCLLGSLLLSIRLLDISTCPVSLTCGINAIITPLPSGG